MHRLEESGDMYIDDDPKIPRIRKVDKITQDMFYYALSIKNYLFESPMYVRIISQKAAK
jgi:hypothetical protein